MTGFFMFSSPCRFIDVPFNCERQNKIDGSFQILNHIFLLAMGVWFLFVCLFLVVGLVCFGFFVVCLWWGFFWGGVGEVWGLYLGGFRGLFSGVCFFFFGFGFVCLSYYCTNKAGDISNLKIVVITNLYVSF